MTEKTSSNTVIIAITILYNRLSHSGYRVPSLCSGQLAYRLITAARFRK